MEISVSYSDFVNSYSMINKLNYLISFHWHEQNCIRDIEANKVMQFSLLHGNDSQTKNGAYDSAQMESADDVFFTARDYTQGKMSYPCFSILKQTH